MASKGSVLITGCSDDGIGSALALAFVRHGLRVFATARNVSSMSKLANLENVTLLQLDVIDKQQIDAAVKAVSKETGGTLNYLISNAGTTRYMPLLDESIEEAKKIYDTNVWGPLQLIQAFSPLVLAAKGTVVLGGSMSGHVNVPYQGSYAAAKRSLEVMGDILRVELAPFHVKVVSIVTGPVKSKVHSHYEDYKLPENSLYISVESDFIKRARGEDGAPRMDADKYAEDVVSKILAGKSTKFWAGGNAALVKFLVSWLPTSMMDSMLIKGTGVDVLGKAAK